MGRQGTQETRLERLRLSCRNHSATRTADVRWRFYDKACPCFDVAQFLVDYKIHDEEDAVSDDAASPLAIPAVYTVKRGDSLSKISNTLGIGIAELKSINNLTSDVIHPEQELRLT